MISEQKLTLPPCSYIPADIGRDGIFSWFSEFRFLAITDLFWLLLKHTELYQWGFEWSLVTVINGTCWVWPIFMCFSLLSPDDNSLVSENWFSSAFLQTVTQLAHWLKEILTSLSYGSLIPIFFLLYRSFCHHFTCSTVNGDAFPQPAFRQIPPGVGKGLPNFGKNLIQSMFHLLAKCARTT